MIKINKQQKQTTLNIISDLENNELIKRFLETQKQYLLSKLDTYKNREEWLKITNKTYENVSAKLYGIVSEKLAEYGMETFFREYKDGKTYINVFFYRPVMDTFTELNGLKKGTKYADLDKVIDFILKAENITLKSLIKEFQKESLNDAVIDLDRDTLIGYFKNEFGALINKHSFSEIFLYSEAMDYFWDITNYNAFTSTLLNALNKAIEFKTRVIYPETADKIINEYGFYKAVKIVIDKGFDTDKADLNTNVASIIKEQEFKEKLNIDKLMQDVESLRMAFEFLIDYCSEHIEFLTEDY